jgi:hypothetical protein
VDGHFTIQLTIVLTSASLTSGNRVVLAGLQVSGDRIDRNGLASVLLPQRLDRAFTQPALLFSSSEADAAPPPSRPNVTTLAVIKACIVALSFRVIPVPDSDDVHVSLIRQIDTDLPGRA